MNRFVTYSPAYTLVPTYECFNRCSYCNFRVNLGQSQMLTLLSAREILTQLSDSQVAEILVLSGEVPPGSKARITWFERIYQICDLILSLGFLPHTNVGPLSWLEMKQLKQVNVSMGLMLEQLSPRLLATAHKNSPSKDPQLRLQQLEWSGRLRIPFTTGLLLGIGETKSDRAASLMEIAKIQKRWGHIQEVILQPHSLGEKQSLTISSFNLHELPEVVSQAREILPESIAIQIPPNLITKPQILLDCLDAGATDLGGISPKDEVNPDYPHPNYESLKAVLKPAGWNLIPRLPVYPQYYSWLSRSLRSRVLAKEKTLNLKNKSVPLL
ncbi:MAG: 7,8-didemethyl-8-hydroxy-5-deazariboflavin synthase subunit CofG [Pleurocapsa sp.]